MNGFKRQVYDQMEIAEELLWLHAEVEKKKKMRELMKTLAIKESALQVSSQLNDLQQRLKQVQLEFDERMNEVIASFRADNPDY
ncbi:YgaB family protein [Jeotgalibacillus sp. ET6]|uniref:YgaB family protein n=1 Tax=Jeotgalibacillus sp. ET6 TaxID=3037260 RepID=UPI002418A217|nr:YgaB family protein [Jeotgalibacillus sp. ET6]MDG5473340.1 YgaB family protein [Jeotgalibacillus sp. ET6]